MRVRFVRSVYEFLVEIYNKFNEHNGFLLAAGIAFYTFFSLFPLMLFTGIVLGYVLESAAAQEQIFDYVFRSFPGLADFVRDTIEALIERRSSAGVIALLGLLWAGTGVFGGLAVGLNAVYEVKETRNIVIQRLISVVVFLIIIFLLFLSFAATSIASAFRDQFLRLVFPEHIASFTFTFIAYAIGAFSTFLLFLTVYRFVPNVRLTFRHIWLGTLIAGGTWEVGKYIFTIYLDAFARAGYGLVYGSLATVILFMFWLYISATLLLIGAEISVAYRRRATGGVKTFEPRKGSGANI